MSSTTESPLATATSADHGSGRGRAYVLVVCLLALLAFFVARFRAELFGATSSDPQWQEEVLARSELWLQVLRPDPRLFKTPEELPGFLDKWRLARDASTPAQLDEIRRRVLVYLDFLDTEYADAADIWDSGNDKILSAAARANRERLREAFGELGATIIEQADVHVREAAFKSSPQTIQDKDATDFRKVHEDIRAWTAIARESVEDHVR